MGDNEMPTVGASKATSDFQSSQAKTLKNRKKALKIINDPWWNPEFGSAAKKCFLLVDDSKEDGAKYPITNPVCVSYGTSRWEILRHVKGTVLTKVWVWCLCYCLLCTIMFLLYKTNLHPTDDDHPHNTFDDDTIDRKCYHGDLSAQDDLKCRPAWFNEQFVAIAKCYSDVSRLGKLVLTMFVGLAYKRYMAFYWGSRKVQGKINNIALIIGSVCDYENKSELSIKLQGDLERYLVLVHILMYMNISPYVKDKLSLNDLNKRVLGVDNLVTEEELNILKYIVKPGTGDAPENAVILPGSAGNGPMNTVLVWLQMAFDRALAEKIIAPHHSEARVVAICSQFQDNLCELRGAMATFGFMKQLPIPLAYAHMLQIMIDVICILCPFAVMYQIDSIVVHKAGFEQHSPYATLPLTLAGVFFITYFYQGLLSLAKALSSPFGESMDVKTGELKDREFMINVKRILQQTRAGQFTFFNSGIAAPACCITPSAAKTRAEEAAMSQDGADY